MSDKRCAACELPIYEITPTLTYHRPEKLPRSHAALFAPLRRNYVHNATAQQVAEASRSHHVETIHAVRPKT